MVKIFMKNASALGNGQVSIKHVCLDVGDSLKVQPVYMKNVANLLAKTVSYSCYFI